MTTFAALVLLLCASTSLVAPGLRPKSPIEQRPKFNPAAVPQVDILGPARPDTVATDSTATEKGQE